MKYFVPDEHVLRANRCCYFLDTKSGVGILSFFGFVSSIIGLLAAVVIGFPGSLFYHFSFCIWMFFQAVTSMLSILGIMKEKSWYIFPWICMLFFNAMVSFGTTIISIFIPVEFESVKGKIVPFFATDIGDIEVFANYWWLTLIPFCLLICYAYWWYATYIYFEYVHYVECEDLYHQKEMEYSSRVNQYRYRVLNE